MSIIERLHEMRNFGGEALTKGLPDEVIMQFAERDPRLREAIDVAYAEFQSLCEERPESARPGRSRARSAKSSRISSISMPTTRSIPTSAWPGAVRG